MIRYGAANKVTLYQFATWIPRQNKRTAFKFNFEDGRTGIPTELSSYTDDTLKATLTAWKKVLDTGAVNFTSATVYPDFAAGNVAMYCDSMIHYDVIEGLLATSKKKFVQRMDRMPAVNISDAIGDQVVLMGKGKQTVDKTAENLAKKAAYLLKIYNDMNS